MNKHILPNCLRCIPAIIAVFLSGCVTTEYSVATHKQDIFFYSTQKEISLGKSVSRQINKKYKLVKDPRLNKKVFDIGRKVSAVCDRKELNYYFYIIDEDTINAFSLPGGYVYIYKGLLDILDNDDQIAFVLGHEIGHIVARHSIKRLQSSIGANLLLLASSRVESSGSSAPGTVSLILATIISGYSQEDEFLADKLGCKYAKKAGFDPSAGIKVLEKLEAEHKKEKARPLAYFRSHPFAVQRIKMMKEELGIPLDFQDIMND